MLAVTTRSSVSSPVGAIGLSGAGGRRDACRGRNLARSHRSTHAGPTVVIEAGWDDSSGACSSWVQSPAARTTRYVLARHSAGGLMVRVFAHDYPADVAGVVLIDSMSPSAAKPSNSDSTPESDRSMATTGYHRNSRTPIRLVDQAALLPGVAGRRRGNAAKLRPGGCRYKLGCDTPDRVVARLGSGTRSGPAQGANRTPGMSS
jgi:hypothetical protein